MDNSNCDATMNTDYCAAIGLNAKSPLNIFVSYWSSASVTCEPHPQTSTLRQLGLSDHSCHYYTSWKTSINLSHKHNILAYVQYKPARA